MNRNVAFSKDATLAALAEARLFSTLGAEALAPLANAASLALGAGQVLFSAGEAPGAAYLALEGEIAIELPASGGRSIAVARVMRGDVFGEIGVIDGLQRSASARAVTAARVLPVPRAAFKALIEAHPRLAAAVLEDLAGKLRGANRQVEAVSFRSLPMRLAGLLRDLAGDGGEDIRVTQSELAHRLGASREKVNMHLQEFKAAGAIDIARGRLRCRAPEVLLKIYEGA